MDGSIAPQMDGIQSLERKIDQLTRLMGEAVTLQRVAELEAGNVCRFGHNGTEIALSLPDAQRDLMQRTIMNQRTFFETRQLTALLEAGVVTPGSTVCDVGANIGNHSVYFSRILRAGRIIAFEPQTYCHATLLRNMALNNIDTARAINAMAGPVTGSGRLVTFNPASNGATTYRVDETGDVPMVALDDAITATDRAALTLIKIDVEGMEKDVLWGATELLGQHRPAIWVSTQPRTRALAEIRDFLAPFGYGARPLAPNDHLFVVTP